MKSSSDLWLCPWCCFTTASLPLAQIYCVCRKTPLYPRKRLLTIFTQSSHGYYMPTREICTCQYMSPFDKRVLKSYRWMRGWFSRSPNKDIRKRVRLHHFAWKLNSEKTTAKWLFWTGGEYLYLICKEKWLPGSPEALKYYLTQACTWMRLVAACETTLLGHTNNIIKL